MCGALSECLCVVPGQGANIEDTEGATRFFSQKDDMDGTTTLSILAALILIAIGCVANCGCGLQRT